MSKKIINTPDYCGEDRRGFKINGDLWYRIIYALVIIGIVIGVYRTRIEAIGIEQNNQACELKLQKEKIITTEKDIIILKTELPIIKEDIKEIKFSQNEIQKDIKSLLRQRGM